MKRTLSAAASVVVGGAGAVAFPAAATAVPADASADQLPMEHVADTAMHTTGVVHSAQEAVGDVVPAPEQSPQESLAQSATESQQPSERAGGNSAEDPLAPVTDELGGNPLEDLTQGLGDSSGPLGDVTGGKSLPTGENTEHAPVGEMSDAVGEVVPHGENLPTEPTQRDGAQEAGAVPGMDTASAESGAAHEQQPAGDTEESADQQMPEVDPLADLTGESSPLGEITDQLPLDDAAKSGDTAEDPLSPVTDLVEEGPLSAPQLG